MRPLALATVLLLTGCDKGCTWRSANDDWTAPGFLDPSKSGDADPDRRSWTNPDVAMNEEERADMLSLCTAIAEQDANKGAAGADKGAYGDVRVRSRWGKELRKQIDRDGRHAFAPSFAELLQEEDLHRASPDCERVVQRWRRM